MENQRYKQINDETEWTLRQPSKQMKLHIIAVNWNTDRTSLAYTGELLSIL